MTLQLGLIITERCNIACRHCIFSAETGNEKAKDMLIKDIYHYIDQIANIAEQSNTGFSVSFTGGEPFLRYWDLLKAVAYAQKMGALKISTVTNGFWGSNKKDAFRIVSELKEAGLSNLSLSMDDFHQVNIPLESLRNVISACNEIGMAFTIKTTVTKKSRRLAEVLLDLGDLLLDQKVTIEEIACVPEGRARHQIPRQDLIYKKEMPREVCPMGMMLVILPNGDTFPCCGTGWSPKLFLGNTVETDLNSLYDKMKEQPLYMLLRESGPHCLASYLEAGGYSLNQDQYISNCDLCKKVLTHPGLEQVLPGALHDWRVERVNKMLSNCLNN